MSGAQSHRPLVLRGRDAESDWFIGALIWFLLQTGEVMGTLELSMNAGLGTVVEIRGVVRGLGVLRGDRVMFYSQL